MAEEFRIYDDNLKMARVSLILGAIYIIAMMLSILTYKALPIKLLIVISAVIFNLIVHYFDFIDYFQPVIDEFVSPRLYVIYYLPIYLASSCFKCDKSDFRRVLPVAALTSLLIIAMAFINGYILYVLTNLKWTYFQMFVFGVSTCSSQPDPFVKSMKNKRYIILNQLTKGEYIGTMILSLTIVRLYIDMNIMDWTKFSVFFTYETIGAIVIGYSAGWLVANTLALSNDDPKSCFLIIIATMILIFFAANFFAISPYISVFSMVPSLYRYKQHFSKEANVDIVEFFKLSHLMIDFVLYSYSVHTAIFILVKEKNATSTTRISYCIFGFFCTFFFRSIIYLCLFPVFKLSLSKALDPVVVMVNAWATITSNTAFIIGFMYYYHARTYEYGLIILCQICFSAFCTSLINVFSLEFLRRYKFVTIFTADQASNIKTCLHEIRSLRVKYIYMWKMKGNMTDARWDIVKTLTNIFHTSKNSNSADDMMLWKTVTCPDCGREIQVHEPIKDSTDFSKYFRKLIKNQVKTILTRRTQFGIISNEASKKSMDIVEKCLTFEEHIQQELFQPFMKLGPIREMLYKWKTSVFADQNCTINIPRRAYRAKCFYIAHSTAFNYAVFFVTLYFNILVIFALFITSVHSWYSYVVHCITLPVVPTMMIQMFIYINSYAIFSIRRGLNVYFHSVWHCLEAGSLAFTLLDYMLILYFYLESMDDSWNTYKYIRLIHFTRIVLGLRTSLPKIIHSMEEILVGRISLGYEVSKAIYDAYNELELSINFIFDDNVLMGTECERWIREDKYQLYQIFSYFQFTYPTITSTVRTNQAMEATLTVLNLALEEIKAAGYVDPQEYYFIRKKLRTAEKLGRRTTSRQISPKEIFQNIPWVRIAEPIVQDYFLSGATLKTLQTGEILCTAGDKMNGLYVILTGMLKLEYNPTNEIISNLLRHGLLPIFKYTESLQFFDPVRQSLVPGNSLGEMALIAARPADITVTALKPSKIYHIPNECIHVAEISIHDPINGIMPQMWKICCFNIAVAILKALPKYEFYTQHDIKLKVEAAFVPDLSNYKVFSFIDAIDDLILLHGAVKDYYSEVCYIAPCYLPRSLIKFHMHQIDVAYDEVPPPFEKIEARLMLFPMQDIDVYAVMQLVNEYAELYPGTEPIYTRFAGQADNIRFKETGTKLGVSAAMKAVTQGTHLTKFINLKK